MSLSTSACVNVFFLLGSSDSRALHVGFFCHKKPPFKGRRPLITKKKEPTCKKPLQTDSSCHFRALHCAAGRYLFFDLFHFYDLRFDRAVFHSLQLHTAAISKRPLNGGFQFFVDQYSTFILSRCSGSPAALLNALYWRLCLWMRILTACSSFARPAAL